MASKDWLKAVNNFSTTLDGAMNDTDLEFDVASGLGASVTEFPTRLAIDSEIVEVASVSTDTFTITALTDRGLEGTSKVSHSSGATVKANVFASYLDQVQDRIDELDIAVAARIGGTSGVQRCDGTNNLEVVADSPVSMKVSVGNGAMVWVSWPAGCSVVLATDTLSATLIAPVGNPRIDVAQLDKHGNVEVVGGTEAGSPSAPSASADALKLAEIYMRVGMVSIKDSDDASNGYITDKRTYA